MAIVDDDHHELSVMERHSLLLEAFPVLVGLTLTNVDDFRAILITGTEP